MWHNIILVLSNSACVGTLYTESRVTDVLDKKSGALIILDCRSLSLART